jgi:hypothetical protein
VVDRHQARDISRRDDLAKSCSGMTAIFPPRPHPHVLDLILLDLISRDRARAPLAMAGRDHYL